IHWDARVILCILLAWVFMIGRDFGLSWRFRTLTDRQLRWGQAIKVNMLCEFTSCVTPSAVGGSALGMVFLHREGIELGRATTLMMTTLFLDELFFVVSLPVMMLIVPYNALFGFNHDTFTVGLQTVFWTVYAVLAAWTLILFLGIIVRPKAIHSLLLKIFSLRWLRRWRTQIDTLGANMENTGRDLRRRPMRWWLETFGGTALSWSSRYLVVNALFLGFVPAADQLVVFARQFVVWVVLMISPTPGGSGVSEWLFTTYYGDLIHSAGMALVIALFWRIISYYVYLIIGACIVPGWIRQGLKRKSSDN
nr:flippase-like domain-containing protein [Duncaniella sp.]